MDTVGERIKTLRKANDMTQKEFSEIIGVSRSTLAGYETDKIEPSLNVISRMANTFDLSPAYFLRNNIVALPSNERSEDIIDTLDGLINTIESKDIIFNNRIISNGSSLSRLIYHEIKRTRDSIIQIIKIIEQGNS
jgi:transcriptional regulator with XRE-family HTH domain